MRLLVLDPSGLLPWVVRHAAPEGVEVEMAASLEAAERILAEHSPDAAVVSVPPAQLPWRSFQRICARAHPPVPVLYESCVHASAAEAGLDPADGYAVFLPKPAAREQLRAALVELLAAAGHLASAAPSSAREGSGSSSADDSAAAPPATPRRE